MYNRKFDVKRGTPIFLILGTLLSLLLASTPVAVPALTEYQHSAMINSEEYKREFGYWETIELPDEYKINAIHAALLPTGKVLLVAGSGNDRETFNKYHDEGMISVLRTVIFDPVNNNYKSIETPSDLFCGGHAFMQDGNLLIAGGTSGYELLEGNVEKPAGVINLHNENPDDSPRTFKIGTKFTNETGKNYVSTKDVTLDPAHKIDHGMGNVMIHHSTTKVFVEAVEADSSYIAPADLKYSVEGISGIDAQNIYGQGGKMSLDKQDYRGDNHTYEFDPISEVYIRTGDMKEDRWYPSLPVLTNGDVLAVSGLDGAGIITETTERYNPKSKQWSWGPNQEFPTYPALFRTSNPDVLFFSGSNAGYGPQDKGRDPGFWNVAEDSFSPVKGLRNPDIVETSASIVLPPKKGSNDGSQSSRIMIAGGGGIGESPLVTNRTDIIDLSDSEPTYKPGPDLPEPARYINMTVLPTDHVLASGGTRDYRSKGNSYVHKTTLIDTTNNESKMMAEEPVGRGYHSGSLLLPDGRILTFGNDPLFIDEKNTRQGKFEQRIGIFTPPYLFGNERPQLDEASNTIEARRGDKVSLELSGTSKISYARLIPPSSSTHVTNIEQRSVGAAVTQNGKDMSIQLPSDVNVLPNGWYMVFLVSENGSHSVAKMLQIKS
jgi:hypothetical protein